MKSNHDSSICRNGIVYPVILEVLCLKVMSIVRSWNQVTCTDMTLAWEWAFRYIFFLEIFQLITTVYNHGLLYFVRCRIVPSNDIRTQLVWKILSDSLLKSICFLGCPYKCTHTYDACKYFRFSVKLYFLSFNVTIPASSLQKCCALLIKVKNSLKVGVSFEL